MNDINKVLVTGFLTAKPELRYTPTGIKMVNLRLAIHRKYKNKNQEVKDETEFITAVAWNDIAEHCVKYLQKGCRVFVDGRFYTREYLDKNQQKHYVVEIRIESIEFLGKFEKNQETTENPKEEVK